MKQENTIRAADNQTINGIALTIRTIDGKEKTLTLDQLMQMAGFEKTDKPNQVQFSTEKDGYKLVADANLDPNYPGFNIDGYNGDKLFWLADAETPNESWPHDFVARLYAGAFDYETGAPIAMVKSNVDGVNPTVCRTRLKKTTQKTCLSIATLQQCRSGEKAA